MLISDLGFRPASDAELGRSVLPERSPPGPCTLIPAAVLSADPLISYSGMVDGAPLGLASLAPGRIAQRPAWFLISPTWSIESAERAAAIRDAAVRHRHRHPGHRLVFLCNAPGEAALLQAEGEAAFLYNKTANVSEAVFAPLPARTLLFDAIYNAQLVAWKRHELSLGIERCGFLFYRNSLALQSASDEAAIIARHREIAPGHRFINTFGREGKPERLSPSKVNRHLNSAAVGLCLSAEEGAMFASVEYLLAGLPVVSTPSIGGRHLYHDDEFCLTVAPDVRAVADAVAALKDWRIPPGHIRERTLQRLDRDRTRFIGLLNDILEEGGSVRRLAMPWPFTKPVTMEWQTPQEALRQVEEGGIDAYAKPNKQRFPLVRARWRSLVGG